MKDYLSKAISELQAGNSLAAKRILSDLNEGQPESPPVIHYLGLAEYHLGNIDTGLNLLRKSIQLAPNEPSFLDNVSLALQQEGFSREAAQLIHRALSFDPNLSQLWNRLGEIFLQFHGYTQADECFNNALKLNPSDMQATLNLASSLKSQLRNMEALELLEHRLELFKHNLEFLLQYCESLIFFGKLALATGLLEAAIKQGQKNPEINYLLGIASSALGDFDTAKQHFFQSIKTDTSYTRALVPLAAITKFRNDDPLIPRLQDMLTKTKENSVERLNIYFTLGKAFDDIGSYDEAFMHYQAGNKIAHEQHPFALDDHNRYINEMITSFDTKRVHRHINLSKPNASIRPIFIIGMPRSGTTLVEQMLASHPSVSDGGELTLLSNALIKVVGSRNIRKPKILAELADTSIAHIRASYLAFLEEISNGKQYVTDKLPSNFLRLGLLHILFPESLIIHCERNPLDTCLSCYFTLFQQGQEFSYDLLTLAGYYKAYQRIMAHWHAAIADDAAILSVDYEDLAGDPRSGIARILNHCSLPFDDACLNFHQSLRVVKTASVFQARQPLYTKSIGRWKHYKKHLAPLINALYP